MFPWRPRLNITSSTPPYPKCYGCFAKRRALPSGSWGTFSIGRSLGFTTAKPPIAESMWPSSASGVGHAVFRPRRRYAGSTASCNEKSQFQRSPLLKRVSVSRTQPRPYADRTWTHSDANAAHRSNGDSGTPISAFRNLSVRFFRECVRDKTGCHWENGSQPTQRVSRRFSDQSPDLRKYRWFCRTHPAESIVSDVMQRPQSYMPASESVCPDWITPELVQRTLSVWQKRSLTRLTEADAIEILRTVGRLADVLMTTAPRGTARAE
ncbi:MAG: hypothetical protein KatS3mg104_1540 [Phycisphaerae bacterium]|nr:MAG: hypothetical protein KatS3mg104_1540 [Phycisphaerae bacterium]